MNQSQADEFKAENDSLQAEIDAMLAEARVEAEEASKHATPAPALPESAEASDLAGDDLAMQIQELLEEASRNQQMREAASPGSEHALAEQPASPAVPQAMSGEFEAPEQAESPESLQAEIDAMLAAHAQAQSEPEPVAAAAPVMPARTAKAEARHEETEEDLAAAAARLAASWSSPVAPVTQPPKLAVDIPIPQVEDEAAEAEADANAEAPAAFPAAPALTPAAAAPTPAPSKPVRAEASHSAAESSKPGELGQLDDFLAAQADRAVAGDFETPHDIISVGEKPAGAPAFKPSRGDGATSEDVAHELDYDMREAAGAASLEGDFEAVDFAAVSEVVAAGNAGPAKSASPQLAPAAVKPATTPKPAAAPKPAPVVKPAAAAEVRKPRTAVSVVVSRQTRRFLGLLNSPLRKVAPSARNAVGYIAILTLFNATVLLVGSSAGWFEGQPVIAPMHPGEHPKSSSGHGDDEHGGAKPKDTGHGGSKPADSHGNAKPKDTGHGGSKPADSHGSAKPKDTGHGGSKPAAKPSKPASTQAKASSNAHH